MRDVGYFLINQFKISKLIKKKKKTCHHILGENYVHIGKSHDKRDVTIAVKLMNEVTYLV
jgi:hypothetical protein